MTQPDEIISLLAPLRAVQRLLDRFGDRGIIIGGVAASLLGRPRLTADVDAVLLLSVDELPRLIEAANDEGLVPRIADAADFVRRNRVLLLRHATSGIDVDISLGMLPFEVEVVERGLSYQVGPLSLRLPSPEDLVILKAVAHRPKDLEDIRAIVEMHTGLDWKRIETWVRQFAEVLESPEIWDDIDRLR